MYFDQLLHVYVFILWKSKNMCTVCEDGFIYIFVKLVNCIYTGLYILNNLYVFCHKLFFSCLRGTNIKKHYFLLIRLELDASSFLICHLKSKDMKNTFSVNDITHLYYGHENLQLNLMLYLLHHLLFLV